MRGSLKLVALVLMLASGSRGEDARPPLRIGVVSYRGAEETRRGWNPLAEYLTRRIPGQRFEVVPLEIPDVVRAVRAARVEFLLPSNAQYVLLDSEYGVSPIATVTTEYRQGKSTNSSAAVVFFRAGRTDIKSLRDLTAKRLAITHPAAFSGWLTVAREMKRAGVARQQLAARLELGGNSDDVVYAVRDGRADAGATASGLLERMAEEGKIRLEEFDFVPYGGGPEEATFPFRRSTRLYPESPFVKLRHTPEDVAQKVAILLLEMRESAPRARPPRIAGFAPPANNQPVHDCLRELGVAPYGRMPKPPLKQVVRQYWPGLLAGLLAILLLTGAMILALSLNRRLRQSNAAAARARQQLEFTEFAVEHAA